MQPDKIIFIIDDDRSVRKSLSLFLQATGYEVETYASAEDYLLRENYQGIGCIILDVKMEGKSGPELQDELIHMDSHLPIIFITGQGNIPMSVSALRKGAVNFLEKPFPEGDLLRSVKEAVLWCEIIKTEQEEKRQAQTLVKTLTPREHEILTYLITGMLNKQIAYELDIAEHTVKLHRQRIVEKLGVKSVPEILRIADKAGIVPAGKKF
jgi:two-component system, LuxR family, response regulator FixJ